MVILVREGRKKFGYPSKPNCGSIVNTKSMFPCQKWYKMRYKPKKLDIFKVKMKNSIEYAIIKISLPLWHLLHSYNDLEFKISQISFKIGQKEKK